MNFLKRYREYKKKYEQVLIELEEKDKEIKRLENQINNIQKESEKYIEFYNKYSQSTISEIVKHMEIGTAEIEREKREMESLAMKNMLASLEKERELSKITNDLIENL